MLEIHQAPDLCLVTQQKDKHKQGETFLASKKEQKEAPEPHFLRELKAYLEILETRGHEFFPNPEEEYLRALGAFRLLYRMNVKAPQNITGHNSIGRASQAFFQDPGVTRAIDQLITERMKRYFKKREGSSASVSSARKTLVFKR